MLHLIRDMVLNSKIATVLISFNSIFKFEHDPMLPTCHSSQATVSYKPSVGLQQV